MSGGVAVSFFTVSYSPASESFSTWSFVTPVPAKIHESGCSTRNAPPFVPNSPYAGPTSAASRSVSTW